MKAINDTLNRMTKGTRISVATLFCMLMGLLSLTVAYFTLQIANNPSGDTIAIQSGQLSLQFEDNNQNFRMENILPGDSSTKTVSVTNTSTAEVYYALYFADLTNTFVDDQLKYGYSCLAYTGYGTIDESQGSSCFGENEVTGLNMPASSEVEMIRQYIPIGVGVTHVYSFRFELVNLPENQNDNQGQTLVGRIIAQESEHSRPTIIVDAENASVLQNDTTYRYGYDAIIDVTPEDGTTFGGVSCTNGQTASWANNELTVNNVTSDTICTLTFALP